MTAKEREMHKAITLEMKARKELLKRLQHPIQLIDTAAKKEKDKRTARIENARQFKDYNDAQDAYGYGCITEEEFDEVVKALELGEEYIEKEKSPVEVAAEILADFVRRQLNELHDLEWDLLPEKEKDRIRKQNEEILARREQREKTRNE